MKRFITIALVFSMIVPSLYGNCRCQNQDEKNKKWEEMQATKAAFFTSYMELNKEEAEIFWPLYNKYIEELHKAKRDARICFRDISKLTENEKTSEIEYKKALNAYVDANIKIGEVDKLYISEFYKLMPAEKIARMFMAEEEFRQMMIKKWKKTNNSEKQNQDSKK